MRCGTWGTQNGRDGGGILKWGGDQKLGGTRMMGVQLDGGPSFGVHHENGGPKKGRNQKFGGTKMMGVQLDGDPILGCTVDRGGLRTGGEPKIGGKQNDGGAVGWGTQFWDAPWKMGDPKFQGGN